MTIGNNDTFAEIRKLFTKSNGLLHPESLVRWAKDNPKSALYGCFEWNNSKAGDKYRLMQARNIIMRIDIRPAETGQPTRAFVSIMRDRTNGGGYRPLQEVMDDELMANQRILEALREAKRWSFKYQHLTQLRDIHTVIEKTAVKLEPALAPPEEAGDKRRAVAA